MKLVGTVLYDSNSESFIGVDDNSGGYPFQTQNIQSAKIFKTTVEAVKYRNIFSATYFINSDVWTIRQLFID